MPVSTIRKSYIDLRGINLGKDFIRDNDLSPGTAYPLVIIGLEDGEAKGTLDKSGFIGGLTKLYRGYNLEPKDEIAIEFDGSVIKLTPPKEKLRQQPSPAEAEVVAGDQENHSVFNRQRLRHILIEPFAPGNLSRWNPRTEPDVYMVFGVLAEYTDYRYVSGASKELLSRLGYKAETKPDAILIDRGTDEYLMAEFKVRSAEFKLNHKSQDVDILVCWIDDESNKSNLPPIVLPLKTLLEELIDEGDIDL